MKGKPMRKLINDLVSKSGHHQHRHAVIVMKGGAIIATGYNHGTVHAEIHALSRIWPNKRKGCKIYSIRIRKDGNFGMAKPCPPCEAYLIEHGIKKVYYTTNDGGIATMRL
jgi:pyrimidine deaminase RibD-like protein